MDDLLSAAHMIFGSDIILSKIIEENRDPELDDAS